MVGSSSVGGLVIVGGLLTLLSSGGDLEIQYYDSDGSITLPFNTARVAKVDRRVSAASKLFGSLAGLSIAGVCLQHCLTQAQREIEGVTTAEAEPVSPEDQIRQQGRFARLQALQDAQLKAYQESLPLQLQAQAYAKENNIPVKLAMQLQRQAQAQQQLQAREAQESQQALAMEKVKADLARQQSKSKGEEAAIEGSQKLGVVASRPVAVPRDALKFFLGYSADGNRVGYVPSTAPNGFVIATGSSGSGKTETMKVFCESLKEQGYPFLFFAYHGDMQEIPGATTLAVNNFTAEFGINPFALDSLDPAKGGPAHQRRVAIAQICDLTELGVQQRPTLARCLEYLFSQAGIVDDEPSTWAKEAPNPVQLIKFLEDLMMEFEKASADKEYQANLPILCKENTIATLHGRMEDIFKHPVFEAPRLNPAQLFDGSHVINLSQLGHSGIKFLVTDVILRAINQYAFSMNAISPTAGDRERFRLSILIDEAKVAIGPTPKAIKKFKDSPSSPLNVIFTELRKYGLACFLFSQCLDHFSDEMLKQCGVRLIMKCTPEEATAISKSTGIPESEINDLQGKGDAIFIFGQTRIRTQVEPTKSSGLPTKR